MDADTTNKDATSDIVMFHSSQAEKNHGAHYMLEFADEFEMRTQYASKLKDASCYTETLFIDEFAYVEQYANEFEFSF